MKKKRNDFSKVLYILAGLLLLISIMCFGYLSCGYLRQREEENIAGIYIEELLFSDRASEKNNEIKETEIKLMYKEVAEQGLLEATDVGVKNDGQIEDTYTDDEGVYHVDRVVEYEYTDDTYLRGANNEIYTPDYAVGSLAFVLEYPKCGLRRGVYVAATSEQINHNLQLWMTVLANPAMQLELTSITIKGHNHTSQNLSWNQVKNAEVGDRFTIYSESGVYVYKVNDIFVMPRGLVEESLDNDLKGYGYDTCFLVTCGRENFPASHFKYLPNGRVYAGPDSIEEYYTKTLKSSRYQDYVVEGKMVEKYSLSEYGQMVLEDEKSWRK